jgi:hypothetical protein
MASNSPSPQIDLLSDFKTLQLMIFDDVIGDQTRRLVEYFDDAVVKSKEMQKESKDNANKEFARLVTDAFMASKRIVLFAWKKAHGADLAL